MKVDINSKIIVHIESTRLFNVKRIRLLHYKMPVKIQSEHFVIEMNRKLLNFMKLSRHVLAELYFNSSVSPLLKVYACRPIPQSGSKVQLKTKTLYKWLQRWQTLMRLPPPPPPPVPLHRTTTGATPRAVMLQCLHQHAVELISLLDDLKIHLRHWSNKTRTHGVINTFLNNK